MPGNCVRGAVIQVNLDPTIGSEINKERPCVVIQNDTGNKYSPTTIVAAITDAEHVLKNFPINVRVAKGEGGLTKDSVVLCNQLRSIDERRFVKTLGHLSPSTMTKVDAALKLSLAL